MSGDERDVLVAPRWNPFRPTPLLPGSSRDRHCDVCGRRVVLAPSSVALAADRPVRVVCDVCGPDLMAAADTVRIVHL